MFDLKTAHKSFAEGILKEPDGTPRKGESPVCHLPSALPFFYASIFKQGFVLLFEFQIFHHDIHGFLLVTLFLVETGQSIVAFSG